MKKSNQLILLFLIIVSSQIQAQFSAGVNKQEALDLVKLSYYPYILQKGGDSLMKAELPNYEIVKTVDSVAMDNVWCIVKTADKGVVSFRGTTLKQISWMENFYSAMIPAKGQMTLPNGELVNYKFAEDERAGIQTGWSLAIMMMRTEIIQEIKKLNDEGIYDIYITGHSQGGALSLLFTSFLVNLPDSILSKQNQYKTYAFAAPKPGNRFFSYEYSKRSNAQLNSYTFINPYDWVPQTPFTVQSPSNITPLNPFLEFEKSKEGSFVKRIALHSIYKSMINPIEKAQKNLNKNLGKRVNKIIVKEIGEFQVPDYMMDAAYFPAGTSIILSQYLPALNPEKENDVFWQHMPHQYIKLINDYFKENN